MKDSHCNSCGRKSGYVFGERHEGQNKDGSCLCQTCVSMCWGDPLDCANATIHRKTEELCLMLFVPKPMVWSSLAEEIIFKQKDDFQNCAIKLKQLAFAIRKTGREDNLDKVNFLAGIQYGIKLGREFAQWGTPETADELWNRQIIYARAIGTSYTYYFFEKDEETLLIKLKELLQQNQISCLTSS